MLSRLFAAGRFTRRPTASVGVEPRSARARRALDGKRCDLAPYRQPLALGLKREETRACLRGELGCSRLARRTGGGGPSTATRRTRACVVSMSFRALAERTDSRLRGSPTTPSFADAAGAPACAGAARGVGGGAGARVRRQRT
eukprot:497412-Prorocentrum_minimum.AAC.1